MSKWLSCGHSNRAWRRNISSTFTRGGPGSAKRLAGVSQREIEVLELVACGLSNKQIAYSLEITETTAKNHVQHILQKLGAQDRTRATTVAIKRGIIHL
jgi:DNA-binding NarL/FixJ family response regulator